MKFKYIEICINYLVVGITSFFCNQNGKREQQLNAMELQLNKCLYFFHLNSIDGILIGHNAIVQLENYLINFT